MKTDYTDNVTKKKPHKPVVKSKKPGAAEAMRAMRAARAKKKPH